MNATPARNGICCRNCRAYTYISEHTRIHIRILANIYVCKPAYTHAEVITASIYINRSYHAERHLLLQLPREVPLLAKREQVMSRGSFRAKRGKLDRC